MKEKLFSDEDDTVYEIINFYYHFKNEGYVNKILFAYKDLSFESEYYNNYKRTRVPCINNDILIISDYKKDDYNIQKNNYILVQIDFSLPIKFKVLINTDEKADIYTYILENNLVKIKTERKKELPKFNCGYGKILVEILISLKEDKNDFIKMEELYVLVLNNLNSSNEYQLLYNELNNEQRESNLISAQNRLKNYLEKLYENEYPEGTSLDYILEKAKTYYYNYKYNL